MWGKVLSTTDSMASIHGTVQPFRYRGYVYDVETGLYYLRNRYYDPGIGRFYNVDIANSYNRFQYCTNNPLKNIDVTGTRAQPLYDPEKAVEFAINHYDCMDDYDLFYYEKNNNCARFVSACLYAGFGDIDSDDWHDRHLTSKNDVTPTWRLAKEQYKYLLNSGYVSDKFSFSDPYIIPFIIQDRVLRPGDIIYKQYINEKGVEAWHATIINRVTEEMVYYTADSDRRMDEPLTTMWNEGTDIVVHVLLMDNW